MTQPKTASKFTPGGWSWRFLAEGHGYETLVGSNGFRILIHSSEDGEIKEHDKLLIAKAPEMYELLEHIAKHDLTLPCGFCMNEAHRIKAEIDVE